MSGKFSSLITFVFLIAIAVAANRAEENTSVNEPVLRKAASLSGIKEPLASVEAPLFRHTEKIHGPLEAQIELIGANPSEPGDVFSLKATVETEEALRDIDFKWSLPKGLELVNGELKGRIASIGEGHPAELQITVKTRTGQDHQVTFMTGATLGGARFAQSVQYSTILQAKREAQRQTLKKSTEKSVGDSNTSKTNGLKIFD